MTAVANTPLLKLLKIVIGALIFLLLLEILWLVIMPLFSDSDDGQNAVNLNADLKPIESLPPENTFREAVDRSLFAWNRRPVTPEGEQPVDEEGLSSRWLLSGVVDTGNEVYAMFAQSSGDLLLRLEEGMYLERWKIISISPEAVSLQNDGDEEIFRLKEVDTVKEGTTNARSSRQLTPARSGTTQRTTKVVPDKSSKQVAGQTGKKPESTKQEEEKNEGD